MINFKFSNRTNMENMEISISARRDTKTFYPRSRQTSENVTL